MKERVGTGLPGALRRTVRERVRVAGRVRVRVTVPAAWVAESDATRVPVIVPRDVDVLVGAWLTVPLTEGEGVPVEVAVAVPLKEEEGVPVVVADADAVLVPEPVPLDVDVLVGA